MKKLLALFVFLSILCAWPTASNAQGIESGNQLVSGYLGGGVPLQESGIEVNGTDLDWGNGGVSYGISYFVFPSAYFGIGAEISGSNFNDSEYYDAHYVQGHFFEESVETSMNLYNVMLAFRTNLNPQSSVRFYIPFGAGLTSAEGKVKTETSLGNFNMSGRTNSFGYFVGVGLEADLGQSNWMLGGEMRYNGFTFDTGKVSGDGYEVRNGSKEHYSYLSFLFKVGYKF